MAPRKSVRKKSPTPRQTVNKSVSIKQVSNGFVVSQWSDRMGKEITKIAKTKVEAKKYANQMLGL